MKYLALLMLVTAGAAHAQILSQRDITVSGDQGFIERTVQIPDASGAQVAVKQILRLQVDGSLTYMPLLQHEETRSYYRAMCEAMGGSTPSKGESTWGPNTLTGFACDATEDRLHAPQGMQDGVWLKSLDLPGEGASRLPQIRADSFGSLILQAYAPKNFAIRANQNTFFSGRAQVITDTAGYIASRLQIGDGCVTGHQDWVNANSNRLIEIGLLCFATGNVPTINTAVTSCMLGRCATDTGKVTVI
jgi:hypothetical protein